MSRDDSFSPLAGFGVAIEEGVDVHGVFAGGLDAVEKEEMTISAEKGER